MHIADVGCRGFLATDFDAMLPYSLIPALQRCPATTISPKKHLLTSFVRAIRHFTFPTELLPN